MGATIKNVRIENADVTAHTRSGILLGSANCFSCSPAPPKTEITQVSVTGNITGSRSTSE